MADKKRDREVSKQSLPSGAERKRNEEEGRKRAEEILKDLEPKGDRQHCDQCRGTGSVWGSKCDECGGTGYKLKPWERNAES